MNMAVSINNMLTKHHTRLNRCELAVYLRILRSLQCFALLLGTSFMPLKVCIVLAGLRSYRSYSVAGPTAWNSLLQSIRNIKSAFTFKRYLKTHLFKCAYN